MVDKRRVSKWGLQVNKIITFEKDIEVLGKRGSDAKHVKEDKTAVNSQP